VSVTWAEKMDQKLASVLVPEKMSWATLEIIIDLPIGFPINNIISQLGNSHAVHQEVQNRERDCFYYIIEQTYDVGLHSRRHPMEFDAGTRPFASFNAPSS